MSARVNNVWGVTLVVAFLVVLGLLVIQFIPYGRDHTNPPEVMQPQWNSAQTEALFTRACADCHSHQTVWPWYSNIAPVSWLVQRDVLEGREKFNISAPAVGEGEGGEESAEQIERGAMPPWFYGLLHPSAQLTAEEKQALVHGLAATFGEGIEGSGSGGRSP